MSSFNSTPFTILKRAKSQAFTSVSKRLQWYIESSSKSSSYRSTSNFNNTSIAFSTNRVMGTLKEETALVDNLLENTSKMIDMNAANVIAFSGGIDSTLVASLVQQTFTGQQEQQSLSTGTSTAILGISPAVPKSQIELARHIAHDIIGIPLLEIPTNEGQDATYIKNEGEACLACKTHLYSTLESVAKHALHSNINPSQSSLDNHNNSNETDQKVILFNGTNKDDTADPTRLGLIAASNFSVKSPLQHISKEQVRKAAKHLGLPNWNYSASPCLRSRLAFGVEATSQHLKMVEEAEIFVNRLLALDVHQNMRVRLLSAGRVAVELDINVLEQFSSHNNGVKSFLIEEGFLEVLSRVGFERVLSEDNLVVRPFKTGSVAVVTTKGSDTSKIIADGNYASSNQDEGLMSL